MKKQTVLILGDPNETIRAWVEAFQQRGLKVLSTSSTADVTRLWREPRPC